MPVIIGNDASLQKGQVVCIFVCMPIPKSKLTRFNMLLPDWLLAAMKRCAERKGITMTEFVKDAIKEAVRKDEEHERRNDDL